MVFRFGVEGNTETDSRSGGNFFVLLGDRSEGLEGERGMRRVETLGAGR